ncbi:MAG: P-loop NTPase fold protein [Phycisphaerales bacterium]
MDKKENTLVDVAREQRCTFLPDFPTCNDDFGFHKRIAESIANQVNSSEESKTIGLEGTWGSGKSSIIKMLEKKWEKEKNVKVFTYDAWEHQGDHLRRAFLEELIKSLTDERNKWLENCSQSNLTIEDCYKKCGKEKRNICPNYIKENLRHRYEHNVIDSEPYITKEGIFFAASTLLMPIWLTLIPIISNLYARTGLIVLAIVPLAVIGDTICRCHREGKDYKEFIGELFGKSREISKHTTQRTPEPTTIEFQEYYWNLLNKALENKEKRLVIIIDNLDRVDKEETLKIWATLKTFLDDKKFDAVGNRIWVIVPYAHDKIDKLWAQNGDKDLALHFKEKTFQIRYHVPEPLTSKWESYFNTKLIEAIKIDDKDIHNRIFNIFRIIALPKYKNIPTPREMKIFINRIVSLALLFYDTNDASLEEIALYAAFELPESLDFRNLAKATIEQEKNIINFVGKNYRRGLAVIYYGVTKSEADEVMYKPDIERCIKSGDCDDLTQILKSPVAQIVCRNYLHDIAYCWQNLNEFLSASEALSDFKPENSSWHIRRCFETLSHHMIANVSDDNFKPKGSLNDSNVSDLIRIMEFCPDINNKIVDKLSITLTKEYFDVKANNEVSIEATSEQINEKLSQWVSAVLPIVKHIENRNENPTIMLHVGKPEYYTALIGFVHSQNPELIKYFCPKTRVKKDYLNALIAGIKSGTIRPEFVKIIENILKMQVIDETDEALIAQGITPAYSKFNPEQISLMYDILYQHRKIKCFREELEKLVIGNLIYSVLSKFVNTPIAAAQCLVNIFLFSLKIPSNVLSTFQDVLNNPSKNIPSEIAKTIHTHGMFEEVCNSLSNEIKASKCWGGTLKSFVEDDKLIFNITAKRFITDHSYIKRHLDKQFGEENNKENYYDNLVTQLAEKGLLLEMANKPITVDYGKAYYLVISNDKIDTINLEKKLCSELGDIETDSWYKELCNESNYYGLLDVIINLVEKKYVLNLGDRFSDALIRHAKALMDKSKDVSTVDVLASSWNKILDSLSESYRNDFREKLLDLIVKNDGSVLLLPEIYKDEIIAFFKIEDTHKQDRLETRKKSFVYHPCKQISENKNICELKWMFDILLSNNELLKKATKDDYNFIKDHLKDFLVEKYNICEEDKEADAINKDTIGVIAKQLGINLRKEQSIITYHDLLLNNEWQLFYNPDKFPNKSKPIIFGKEGKILEGNNQNESSWRTKNGYLEIIDFEGKVHSRFTFDQKNMRFNHTNEADTNSIIRDSIKNQFIILNTNQAVN